MSDLNDMELLISFDELKQLEIDAVPAWADRYNALSICKESSAEPSEIYNLWVQKLLKAYDLKEFANNDWRIIIEYLKDILDGVSKNSKHFVLQVGGNGFNIGLAFLQNRL